VTIPVNPKEALLGLCSFTRFVSWLALLHRARERHVACNAAYRNAAVPTVWVEWDVTVEQDAADGAVLGPIRTRRSMPCHAMGSRGRNRAAPD